jgi:hypothetical protein
MDGGRWDRQEESPNAYLGLIHPPVRSRDYTYVGLLLFSFPFSIVFRVREYKSGKAVKPLS